MPDLLRKAFGIGVLPFTLAALPFALCLLLAFTTVLGLDILSNLLEPVCLALVIVPVLAYDAIGLIHFSVLGGTSTFLAGFVYVLTTAVAFFAVGALIDLWRRGTLRR